MLCTGVRLKDKYLILQTHNPKRMFKLARGEEGGGEESTHDDDQGVFLQMVKPYLDCLYLIASPALT